MSGARRSQADRAMCFSAPADLVGGTVIALVGTLVESLPFKDVDNITVTLVAVLLGQLIF